jgi:hypothetical protein
MAELQQAVPAPHLLIPDFGLSAAGLQAKYVGNGDDGHPKLTPTMWRGWVREEYTILGYWAWVRELLNAAQDELDADNPYNQERQDA